MCAALKNSGHEAIVQAKTGLLLDPYFSATKMRWMLQNQREVREAGERLALGTVESYLIYRLTGGLHVTDASNASRTMRSEEHTSELQSLMRNSYAVFCLKKKKHNKQTK